MIRVHRPPASDPSILAIVNAAGAARQALLDAFYAGQKPSVVDARYKAYKSALIAAFHEKCAYCDSFITDTQHGHVEHYRPKNRCRDNEARPIEVDYPIFGRMEHLGYFWLAYDWENLLPACDLCNTLKKYDEVTAGKGDRFPVRDFRAHLPGEEADEQPLLIDPTRIDPDPHFKFSPDGMMRGVTDEGEATIKLLGLNVRERLVRERARAYDGAQRALDRFLGPDVDDGTLRSLRAEINNLWEGREEHTAHARLAISGRLAHYQLRGINIPMPIPPID
jgi:hypothetical protein